MPGKKLREAADGDLGVKINLADLLDRCF